MPKYFVCSYAPLLRKISYDQIGRWARKIRANYLSSMGLVDEPKKFKNIRAFTEHLKIKYPSGEIPVQYGGENYSVRFQEVFSGKRKNRHLILYNHELLSKFQDHEIFCDATFSAFPKIKKMQQLFTVMGKKFDLVGIFSTENRFFKVFRI